MPCISELSISTDLCPDSMLDLILCSRVDRASRSYYFDPQIETVDSAALLWKLHPVVEIKVVHLLSFIHKHLDSVGRKISQGKATHSISTSTPLGSSLTATQLRAGFVSRKCSSYSLFISAKFFISVRNTVIFTTLLRSLPASLRISWIFCMHREAL